MSSATYDAANQITSWNSTSFTYDDNGNLTDDGPTTYAWDPRNQLAELSGGVSASFAYDGLGRRRSRTVSGTSRSFLYDGLNLAQELASGTPTANLLTGLAIDETFTRAISGGTETLLLDSLGSTVALTNGSGSVETEYTYAPYGTTAASGTTSANAAQFTGRENDGTGLYYYRFRYYDSERMRFISEDPLGHAGGMDLFSYASNAPTMFKDPLGLKPDPGFGGGSRTGSSGSGGGRGSGRRGSGGKGSGGKGSGNDGDDGDGDKGKCDTRRSPGILAHEPNSREKMPGGTKPDNAWGLN